ncbi:MAG: hypothetical protein JNJ57_05830 [Saprospiraceae bacterium]|nr:hypothetical protein [Saprospiraceae bacterium]
MTKTKLLLPAILAILPVLCMAQPAYNQANISGRTGKLADRIEKVNTLMGEAVYYDGIKPKQWENFENLEKTATNAELVELCRHPNGVVRCYAFWALSHQNHPDLFEILLQHLNDTTLVETQFGCLGGAEKVGDFFIDVMTPDRVDLDSKKMTSHNREMLDSLLIFQPNRLAAKSSAIFRAKPTEKIYPKLRELYLKEHDQNALLAMARFKKEADIELILRNRDTDTNPESGYHYTYMAMLAFPHPAYRPLLESNLEKTLDEKYFSQEWLLMYKVIASYQDQKSVELLMAPFTRAQVKDIRPYHIEFVYEAIREFRHPIYDDLYWKIWEEENLIEPETFAYLLNKNPGRAYQDAKRHLDNSYELQNDGFQPNLDSVQLGGEVLESMLNLIIANDTAFANRVITQKIATVSVHQISLYTSKVKQQAVFIEPLFDRLENEWNAHVSLKLVETLIAYQSEQINRRILETRKINPKLNEGWGGKALDKLLLENNIK